MMGFCRDLVNKGKLSGMSMSVHENGVTFYMYKGDYEISHTYKLETIENMYNELFAIKSELEQMAIDLCRLAAGRSKEDGNSTV